MFNLLKEFFVARRFVSKHGNRFLTVYHEGKHYNGQVARIGLLSVTIRKARPSADRYVTVGHSKVVKVHRDHMRLRVKQEKQAIAI